MTKFIEVKEVNKRFGKNGVLKDLNLNIPEGQIFGILGINGSGKTTLLKIIIGFLKPEKGEVYFKKKKIEVITKNVKNLFGFSTQETCFYDKLSVYENLKYFGQMYGIDTDTLEKNIKDLLHLVRLADAKDRLAENLSNGMKRRLEMACAMIHNPEVLILDEPTEDLDVSLRKEICELIRKINRTGTTIILTSHLLSEIEPLCDRVAVLHRGKIIQEGKIDSVISKYSKSDEIHLITKQKRYDAIAHKLRKSHFKIEKIEKSRNKITIYTPQGEFILHYLLHYLERTREDIVDIEVKKPNLVEIFESLTKTI